MINAIDATQLSNRKVNDTRIQTELEYMDAAIRSAAEEGRYFANHTLKDGTWLGTSHNNGGHRYLTALGERLNDELRKLGYTMRYDPYSLSTATIITISWGKPHA